MFDYNIFRLTLFTWILLQGSWVSMGVTSTGAYGIEKGLIYSFPVHIGPNQTYTIVEGLPINNFAREKMDATMAELIEERDTALEACEKAWQTLANL